MHRSPSAYSVQRRVGQRARNNDAYAWFSLLTSPEMFDEVESLLPEHRERLFAPTETLSMFLSQALSADRSCQNAVNEAAIRRARGLAALQYAHRGLLPGATALARGDGAHAGPLQWAAGYGARAPALVLARPSGTVGGRHHGAVA